MLKIGIFLDRDGVLNINTHYPHLVEDCFPCLSAKETMELILSDKRFIPIVVINQAGVGCGYYSKEDCFAFEEELQRQLGIHLPTNHWYHSWSYFDFELKPKPGMLIRAAKEHNIDLGRSAMFGDKQSDMEAGTRAGCCATYLVGPSQPPLYLQVKSFMELILWKQ